MAEGLFIGLVVSPEPAEEIKSEATEEVAPVEQEQAEEKKPRKRK